MEFKEASVSNLPYEDDKFDIVTAFETIQFWPDLPGDLIEIKRVLNPNGKLSIMNRFPKENSKWYDWCQIKTIEQYEELFTTAGFTEIKTDAKSKPGWICVSAIRL